MIQNYIVYYSLYLNYNESAKETVMYKKEDLLRLFREKAYEYSQITILKISDYKKQTAEINNYIKTLRTNAISDIVNNYNKQNKYGLLESILMITYVSYIVMLEYRNKLWEYEYMAFARRIGELWEPFCKIPFQYPIFDLKLIEPQSFIDIQNQIINDAEEYIKKISIDNVQKEKLLQYINIPWQFVDSGCVKLDLDLHFCQNGENYNCDFKSGFSSNEKGNTNRLLLVASIYKFLKTKENNIIFVRQKECENNHYLQTLKKSNLWSVYCCDDAYAKIYEFTGFNLKDWINKNIDWQNDIERDFKKHLQKNDLLKYLTW